LDEATPRSSVSGYDHIDSNVQMGKSESTNEVSVSKEEIYDEEGRFINDDLRNAQSAIWRINDYAHRFTPIDETIECSLDYLERYYGEVEKITTEFSECVNLLQNELMSCKREVQYDISQRCAELFELIKK